MFVVKRIISISISSPAYASDWISIDPTNSESLSVVEGGPCNFVGIGMTMNFTDHSCRWYFAKHDSCFTSGCVGALVCRSRNYRCLCLAIHSGYSEALLSAHIPKIIFLHSVEECKKL